MTHTSAPAAQSLHLVQKLIREVHGELHPHGPAIDPKPGRSLDRDLGLDSLARVELLARLERATGTRFQERVAAEAETVQDLVRALDQANPAGALDLSAQVEMPAFAVDYPVDAETLIDVLEWHADRHPDRTQIWLYGEDDAVQEITFAELLAGARRVAAGLIARGIEPGQTVALMFPTGTEFIDSFFGVLLAGATPVPLYPPARPSQLEAHLRRQAGILRRAEARLMLTVGEAKRLGLFLESQVPTLTGLATLAELSTDPSGTRFPASGPDDVAFLQFTSGSTGDPKGVVLTHANLLANMRAVGEFAQPVATDVFVSWLPLYHDMGLIGSVLTTLYHGVPLVLMSPLTFLTRPERWLQAIHRHRGTLSAAPNFAYALCTRKVPEELIAQLDLSAWRMTLNGAEPISPITFEAFAERFAPCGYRPEVMTPTYGLAECSLALAMTPVATPPPQVDRIDRTVFSTRRRAVPSQPDDHDPLSFVACGLPMPGHEIRIVDVDSGRELGERHEGRLHFRGPSATQGYFRAPEATQALLKGDGWLDSGDLAYIASGQVYVTGRIKDVIIRAGRNVYPHELEEAVGDVEGIREGCVAVFAVKDSLSHTEKLVVLAETRETDPTALEGIRSRIVTLSSDLLGAPADDVVLAPPQSVLKTSSGKVRRAACRQLYEQGRLGGSPSAVWLQMARLTLTGWRYAARRRVERAAEVAYAAHFWTHFCTHLGTACASIAVVPTRRLRWRVASTIARSFLTINGLRTTVHGRERLGDGPAILVSNHASYLDGIVMAVAIPGVWAPVVKKSLQDQKVMGLLLARLGAVFVDRFGRDAGAEAGRIPDALRDGRTILVFPEGTCLRMPGLLPFQMGAFKAAAEAGVP